MRVDVCVCVCALHSVHMELRMGYTSVEMLAKTHEMIFVQIQAQKVNIHQSEFEHRLMYGEFFSGKILPRK